MRRGRTLFWLTVLAVLALATPAASTTVTVQITGVWDSVDDSASVLDGSIAVGGSFAAVLVYDDATVDSNPDPNLGEYDVAAASSDLSFTSGSYTFIPTSGLGVAVDDDNFGEDAVFLFAELFVVSGPFAPGVSTGGTSYVNPSLIDTSGVAHSSDQLTGLPWSLAAYNFTDFYFFTGVLGAGAGEYIELGGSITGLAVLPEPSLLALGALSAITFAFARHRG